MDLYNSYYSQPSHYYVVNSPYVQGGMADLFDISSAIKSRKTFEDMSSKVGVNPKAQADTSKMRRDPRLKSPKPEDKKSIDNRRPDYQQIQQQQDWMAQTQDYRQVQQQYAMAGYGDPQYNSTYQPMMHNQYPYQPPTNMQPDYQQYQQPGYYPPMGSDPNYMQAPPPPTWQNAPPQQEFRDVPRAPPPPRMNLTPPPPPNTKDVIKKEAVAQEAKQQQSTLRKQRDDYYQKASLLSRELEVLVAQKTEITAGQDANNLPRETQRILKENNKLQVEIQTKLKAINNVIEMLSGIIETSANNAEEYLNREDNKIESQITQQLKSDGSKPAFNFVHYDPELHWCRICDVFPVSAKDYLLHLISDGHRETTKKHQLVDMPWHNTPPEVELPSNPEGPVKRTPIKGIQFFVPAQAWYCKLCDKWIGDLHCASAHLKSQNHIQNFSQFVEQNPHWQTDWITNRIKAYTRQQNKGVQEVGSSNAPDSVHSSSNVETKDKKHKKDKRESRSSSRDKKRRKKSKKRRKSSSDSSSQSSSSSDDSSSSDEDESDKSRSIRVAMRNKMKMQAQMILSEEIGEKLDVLTKLVEDGSRKKLDKDKPLTAKEKDLLTFQNLRNRLKSVQNFKQSQSVSESLVEENKKSGSGSSRRRSTSSERRHGRSRRYDDDRRRSPSSRSKRYDRSSSDRKRYGSSPSRKYDRRSPDRKKEGEKRDEKGFKKLEPPKPMFKDGKKIESQDSSKTNLTKEAEEKIKFPIGPKKLPLIGRMPLFKKKLDENKNGNKPEQKSKFSKDKTQDLPPPGVVQLAPPMMFNAENPPPPPQIVPDPPMIIPEPPHISGFMCYPQEFTTHLIEPSEEAQLVGCLPAPIIIAPPPQPQPTPKGGLPPDLQDALNIIFPGDRSKEDVEREMIQRQQHDEAFMMATQYGNVIENYDVYSTYDGYNMQMIAPPLSTNVTEAPRKELTMVHHHIPHPSLNDANPTEVDDLAMLGIDAEDLAAQIM